MQGTEIERQMSNTAPDEYKLIIKQITLEYVICFIVDNLTNYVVETLRFIFLARPESLNLWKRSDVLKFNSIIEFTQHLAIKKADELTNGGIERMKKYMIDNLGLTLNFSDEDAAVLMSNII